MPRRKVFISYHRADVEEARQFLQKFDHTDDVFISRAVATMPDDVINSTDPDYIMRRIRKDFLRDSTVTMVLIGRCTWARKFCDWELQASLRHGATTTANGLLGIVLPSAGKDPKAPNRLKINLNNPETGQEGFARWYWPPNSSATLAKWIEDAFTARTTRAHLIRNPRENFVNNRNCG